MKPPYLKASYLKALPRRVGSAICCVLLATMALAVGAQGTQQELDQIKGEIGKLKEALQQFKGQRSELQQSLRKSETDIDKTRKMIQKIEQQLKQQEQELQKLEQQRGQLHQAKGEQQAHIGRQVRAAYEIGQQNRLKALLNHEDPETVSRTMVYYDYFNRARAEQIDAYIELLGKLDTLQPEIEKKAEDLRVARQDLDKERRQLLEAQAQRSRTLASLNSNIQSKDEQLKQRARDRDALEQVLKKIEREARAREAKERTTKERESLAESQLQPVQTGRPFRELRGQLPWPVAGKPDNRFGGSRYGSEMRWQGISIRAREGDTVQAIHNGKVVFADWLRGSGLLIIVDHGDGYISLYAHNQTLLKATGDAVKAGDAIATVGSSGGENQAGLYFEIRHKGVPADPAAWCRRA
jgi:septal ring factor EnvC (AmiA/AmiB activator)